MSVGQLSGAGAFAEVQRRKAYVAPLFSYLLAHYYVPGRVARAAGELESAAHGGDYVMTSTRLALVKRGELTVPSWLVVQCCAAIEKTVEEVMGVEWVRRFGADGCGGSEVAPVGTPRSLPRSSQTSQGIEMSADADMENTAA